MAKQEDIRPIYHELQGYHGEAPNPDKMHNLEDAALWDQVNKTIDELNSISGEDYSQFKIKHLETSPKCKRPHVPVDTYRGKLAGLIARLHGQYFASEPAPFSGMPSTVISQTQVQSQSQTQMVLDLQSKIDEQLLNLEQLSELFK